MFIGGNDMKGCKRFFALLTAVCTLTAMPLSVSAASANEAEILQQIQYCIECMDDLIYHDEVLYLREWTPDGHENGAYQFMGNVLSLVTDGTELTRDTVDMEECVELTAWDSTQWPELDRYADGSIQIPEGSTVYYLLMDTENTLEENCALAREYAVTHDFVTEIYMVSEKEYDSAVWSRSFSVYTSMDVEELNAEDFPEFAELNGEFKIYDEYDSGVRYWSYRVDSASAQAINEKFSNNMLSIYNYVKDIETSLNENHKESVLLANANFTFTADVLPENPTHYILHTVWDDNGDFDGNGEVNSSDAAGMLTHSAAMGARTASTLTQIQLTAGDINCDGSVDAFDAAGVLSYAAKKGSGAEVSWLDIIKS